jgi:thiol-disulfide isomerase/thioredoxin
MMRRVLAAGLILSLAAAARAEGPLSVGDPAPKLQVKEFVKGEPVKKLEKDKLYVVEFWATWCGPCRESIPHLTKLQKEHKDVVFIGVSVSEQDFDKVKPFVQEMGDLMDYRVAIDAVPEGKTAEDGAMNKTWMEAAEQSGIPTAFVVDKDGKIAWIGHPGRIDKPLKLIAAGKWDAKAEKARAAKLKTVAEKIKEAVEGDDQKGALATLDEAVKDDPKMEESLGRTKFQLLLEAGNVAKAADYGRRLTDEVFKDDAEELNDLAWSVVDPKVVDDKKPDPKVVRVALAAATRAVALTQSKDASLLDTLANAHFVNGDVNKAIEMQAKALKLKPGDDELLEHMDTFKKAKEDK